MRDSSLDIIHLVVEENLDSSNYKMYLLNKYLDVPIATKLYFTQHNKPYIHSKDMEFNFSHSESFTAMAYADFPVGVDIERIANISSSALRRVLTPKQYNELYQLKNSDQFSFLIGKYWTSVEAILKAIGTGFYLKPRQNTPIFYKW